MFQLGLMHLRAHFAEFLYYKARLDILKPTMIYAVITNKCNYKCRYCGYWRISEKERELTVDEWKKALIDMKNFIGNFHVEFSGGEPFVNKNFPEILKFCYKNKIKWGVTTNGSMLSKNIINTIIENKPFNINISVDSHIDEVHDYIRGVTGSLKKIKENITILLKESKKKRTDFPIIIKPTVSAHNFMHLPEMVEYFSEIDRLTFNFQPMDQWTKESIKELWIEEERFPELEKVIHKIISLKKSGAGILNSEEVLKAWPAHFRKERASKALLPCKVGMQNYFIRPNGDVEMCWNFNPIGNIKRQTAKEIWTSQKARRCRKATMNCTKLCLFTCLSQKTLADKLKIGLTLLKSAACNL
jgi:MoaA/NifB/PqqE/SkfB family radical SAM enzyme